MLNILITGGTGFLGRELGRQLGKSNNVFLGGRNAKQNAFAAEVTGCSVFPLDITNMKALREAISTYRPDVILHAAATKYVNLSEKFPNECIDINITGSQNVARAAMDFGVKTVVGISTDKATPPCKTIYGISKNTMEKLFLLLNAKTETKFTCIRFGNIVWSTGSVFPIWEKMLAKENLIKTTGYHMRRYMFPVDEAAAMVVEAMNNIHLVNGKIMAAKMNAAHMKDVLRLFIELNGGSFEKIDARRGENDDEIMIGETELENTRIITINEKPYYLIDPNTKTSSPLKQIISTETSPKMTDNEIMKLIKVTNKEL
jgi:UDP-N-acetylglucosamine 4,6-dehydratase